jgi:hypothetical protein
VGIELSIHAGILIVFCEIRNHGTLELFVVIRMFCCLQRLTNGVLLKEVMTLTWQIYEYIFPQLLHF